MGVWGVFSARLELLDRLSALVTPPRVHKHRYCGVLAPYARLRQAVAATLDQPQRRCAAAQRSAAGDGAGRGQGAGPFDQDPAPDAWPGMDQTAGTRHPDWD